MTKIKRILLAALILLTSCHPVFAALATSTQFQIQSGATANFVNGAGFNPANAHFATDFSATSATGSSPIISSAATDVFTSADVGSWVYISAGTNWNAGEYCQIASVNTGSSPTTATLTASIGSCITSIGPQGVVTTNATAGIASTASPSSGSIGIDYSQQNTAAATETTGTQTAASTTFSDTTNSPFTSKMAGDLIHITACTGTGCLPGWYEIASVTSSSAVILDRTATNGSNNITAATYYIGGAGNFGALEDTFQSILPASAIVWIKNGTYNLSASISTTNSNVTTSAPAFWIGYNSIRGDGPSGSNRPTIATSTNSASFGGTQIGKNLVYTTSATSTGVNMFLIINTKISNLSSTASSPAFSGAFAVDSELISLNGNAISNNGVINLLGNYIHDSATCINEGSTNILTAIGNILEACPTDAIVLKTNNNVIESNTIYGREAKVGVGISIGTTTGNKIANNILYGLTTGISGTGNEYTDISHFNDFYNNTTDVTDWTKSSSDLALNPTFTNETNLVNTGTVTSSTTTLTDTGTSFGVTNNVDILHITAITGSGCVTGGYLITGHTTTTLTLNNSAGATCTAITYFITHGHNFQIGTNLKGIGFPNFTNATASETTSYPDTGGVQRQEPAGGGVVGYAAP